MGDIVPKPVAEINRKIQAYQNGDVEVDLSSKDKVFHKLHRLFGMTYWSESRYLKIKTPTELVAFRLSDHRAVGRYFQMASGDCNRCLSMFIGEVADHQETPVAYTEIRYTPESFRQNPKRVIDSMFDSLRRFISGEDFTIDPQIGVKADYPKEI